MRYRIGYKVLGGLLGASMLALATATAQSADRTPQGATVPTIVERTKAVPSYTAIENRGKLPSVEPMDKESN